MTIFIKDQMTDKDTIHTLHLRSYHTLILPFFPLPIFQTNTTKGNPAEVEIIRYQALIPVGEVQVKAGAIVDSDGHYTWELIQLKTSANRPREKSYHLSNR